MNDEVDIIGSITDGIRVLVESGYTVWMSSEYEGPSGVNTFEVMRTQQSMVKTHIQTAAAN